MAGLREHVEMKQPGFVDIALREPNPSPPHASGWRKKPFVVALCAVTAVAAVAGTLAIALPGGLTGATVQEGEPNVHVTRDHQMIGDATGLMRGSNVFRQLLMGLQKTFDDHKSEAVNTKEEIVNPEFTEVEEPLQNDKGYEGNPHSFRQGPLASSKIPPDPNFTKETVQLEIPKEHDTKERRDTITKNKEVPTVNETPTVNAVPKSKEVKTVKEVPTANEISSKEVQVCETPECAVAAAQISESLDLSANPCEDFYQFACGGWIDKHPVPESGYTGTFYESGDILDKRLRLILESPVSPSDPEPVHMTNRHWESCMDTDTQDSLGYQPLLTSLGNQGGWPLVENNWDSSGFNLATALNNLRSINVYPILAVGVDVDLFNVSYRILYGDAGTVPLGVNLMSSPSEAVLSAYRTFMTEAAKELRNELASGVTDEDIATQVTEVIDFEIAFAQLVMESVGETTDNAWVTDVKTIQQDLDSGVPGEFSYLAFLKEMFTNTGITINEDEPIISFKSPFYANLTKMLANTPARTVANAIGWWWVYDMSQETTYALRNLTSDFQQALYGRELMPRWQHCLLQTNYNLGFALSRAYVDRFFPATAKEETSELVEDLRTAFNALLDENAWMLPDDLQVAREKLEAIDPFVAYPDWIMDDVELTNGYEGLEIQSDQLYNNLNNIGDWFNVNSLASLREKPEHSFLFPPTVVNAFYNPQENTITILAGILQTPFYAHNTLAAINYGGIGMVIGHEMTHGFDNTGRLFDKDGNLVQWWSDETIIAYNERAQCFVDQYNEFHPPELIEVGLNFTVNGLSTEGENIADNGGIREAYKAYQLYVDRYGEEPRLPGLDEFTPDHLFYLGFANVWCEHQSAEAILSQLALDPHSPGRFRVLGPLSNDEEFSKVWNCPAGSPMNRGDDRCLLW